MAPVKVGDKLPDGTVKGVDKQDISIKDLTRGKKVIIFGIPGEHMHESQEDIFHADCRLLALSFVGAGVGGTSSSLFALCGCV